MSHNTSPTDKYILVTVSNHEAIATINSLKKNFSTHHIPIIALLPAHDQQLITNVVTAGADDYIVMPVSDIELQTRITMNIARAERDQNMHPLTKLPGNTLIHRVITERITEALSVLYLDIDNFKAYNDYYGFAAGDKILQHAAGLLTNAVTDHGNPTDFVGHLGGDDFVIVSTPEKVDCIAQAICDDFDKTIDQFYQTPDRLRKNIVVPDRRGIMHTYPLLTVSGALVTNAHRTLQSIAHISQLAAELKKYAQSKPNGETGSNYVKDRRKN